MLDQTFDRRVVEKLCAGPEDNKYEYHETCDSSSVPYKKEFCYCRGELCNGSSNIKAGHVILGSLVTFAIAKFIM